MDDRRKQIKAQKAAQVAENIQLFALDFKAQRYKEGVYPYLSDDETILAVQEVLMAAHRKKSNAWIPAFFKAAAITSVLGFIIMLIFGVEALSAAWMFIFVGSGTVLFLHERDAPFKKLAEQIHEKLSTVIRTNLSENGIDIEDFDPDALTIPAPPNTLNASKLKNAFDVPPQD